MCVSPQRLPQGWELQAIPWLSHGKAIRCFPFVCSCIHWLVGPRESTTFFAHRHNMNYTCIYWYYSMSVYIFACAPSLPDFAAALRALARLEPNFFIFLSWNRDFGRFNWRTFLSFLNTFSVGRFIMFFQSFMHAGCVRWLHWLAFENHCMRDREIHFRAPSPPKYLL